MCQRLIRFFTLAALLCLGALTATASSFIVTITNDSGTSSLRQALPASELKSAPDLAVVSIPRGGVQAVTWRIV